MKKRKNVLSILLLAMITCCWNCSSGGEDVPTPTPTPKPDPTPQEKPKIEVTTKSPVFVEEGSTATVTFTSTDTWTLDVTEGRAVSWCTVSPTSGSKGTNTLTVTTTANDTYDERNAKVTIKAGATTQSFTVTQKQKDGLTVTSNKVELDAKGGEFSIEVKANVNVSYEIEETALEWISVIEGRGLSSKTLSFEAKANNSTNRREGKIFLKGGDELGEVVTVYQEGEEASLVLTTEKAMTIGSEGGILKVELKSNSEIQLEGIKEDWLRLSESRAMSDYTYYFEVDANETYDERNAAITFTNGSQKQIVTITQKQLDALIVTSNKVEMAAEGGEFSIEAKANVEISYEIEKAAQEWISVIEGRGLNSKTLSFKAKANNSINRREGKILLKGSDGLDEVVTVYQEGEEASLVLTTEKAMTIGSEGGILKVELKSNSEIQLEGIKEDWLRLSESRAMSDYTYYFEVDANETYDERNAAITFTNGSQKQIVTIIQKQLDALIVTSNKVEMAAEGGEFSIEAKANVEISYEIEKAAQEWISIVEGRGLNLKMLYFTAKANNSTESREGRIILKGSGGLTETVTIYQLGKTPTLVISSSSPIVVGSKGETIKIELLSNTDYEMILPGVNWIKKAESRAASTYTHYLDVIPNETYDERVAVVVFQSEGLKDSITIVQMQKDAILLARKEYTLSAESQSLSFDVNTSVAFDVSISVDWIKQEVNSRGLHAEGLNFTISENTADEERYGEIKLVSTNLEQIIKITQKSSGVYEAAVREALINFYKATNGDNWTNKTNWCSDKPIYEWYGVNGYPWNATQTEKLVSLRLGNNNMKGTLPDDFGFLLDNIEHIDNLDISGNVLYGKIPESVKNHPSWNEFGWNIIAQRPDLGGGFDLTNNGLKIYQGEYRSVTDLKTGEIIPVHQFLAKNKLTLIHSLDTESCLGMASVGDSQDFTAYRVNKHLDYFNKGLSTVYNLNGEEYRANIWLDMYVPTHAPASMKFTQGLEQYSGPAFGFGDKVIYDSEGNLVYFVSNVYYQPGDPINMQEWIDEKIDSVLQAHLGAPETHEEFVISNELYTSTDYSADGQVITVQKATVGKGIDLVFLGEAFVDKDMGANGHYETFLKQGVEAFFAAEPYKTFRNRFNVYIVKVVSPNSEYSSNAVYRINENDEICFEYAQKIPGINKDKLMVSVIYNTLYPRGRSYTHMYQDGSFVAYMMNGVGDNVINHESGGHGLAKLLDEYVERQYADETYSDEDRRALDYMWSNFGWGANVDWRNNKDKVKWAHFLNDKRYANEGLGLYEGADLKGYGVYRPTENSMMRDQGLPLSQVQFNAPSREQIYKCIMELSEGEGWTYDYEEFVKYDEINRNAVSRSAVKPLSEAEIREHKKHHRSPVFMKGTWRDAIRNDNGKTIVPLR